MDARTLTGLLAEVAHLETAPFHEGEVIQYVCALAQERGLLVRQDQYGNVLLSGPSSGDGPPKVVLAAHMDHPGFEVMGMASGLTEARWMGSIPTDCSIGAKVTIRGGLTLKGQVVRLVTGDDGRTVEKLLIDTDEAPLPGSWGTWALTDFELQDGEIAKLSAADNLAGCAALLATMDILVRDGEDHGVYGLLTRAEEVNLCGALGAIKSELLPKGTPVIVVEATRAVNGARLGMGPVIRVGDRQVLFHAQFTHYLNSVASNVNEIYGDFLWQRALLDGGTCEGTLYSLHGHPTAGISIPVECHHNTSDRSDRIVPEEIHLTDYLATITLLVEACRKFHGDNGATNWELMQTKERDLLIKNGQPHLERIAQDRWST